MKVPMAVRRQGRWVAAIVVITIVAVITGGWILVNERLQTPFDDTYEMHVELAQTPGLVPGLGQPVNVSGVRVGSITSRSLRNGRSLLTVSIDPDKLPAVHRDARAALLPNSPLNDLEVELDPGTPHSPNLPHGATIGIAATTSPPDIDTINSALDSDTRAWFRSLLASFDGATAGRVGDLRAVLRQFGPTAQQLGSVSRALASRQAQVRRLVHNLEVLSTVTGRSGRQLSQMVSAGGDVLEAVAKPERELRATLQQLPATLDAADRGLTSVRGLSEQLGPTARSLLPVAGHLPAALRATAALSRTGTPIVRDQLRPLVRRFQPVASDLSATVPNLRDVTPSLTDSFRVLTYLVNELAYNPPGPQDEGNLKWLSWFMHNLASFVSTQDAHGPVWRGMMQADCTAVRLPGVRDALGSVFSQVGC
jgi:phospholipid/cholesterol/gamma-HCH transport system substrate-binding protein